MSSGNRTLVLAVLVLCAAASLGCSSSRSNLNQTLQQHFQPPAKGPVLLAAYQPWFGRPGHISVGYNSQDPVVLERQIRQARGMGIEAFVVNWYGRSHTFEDRAYLALQQVANQQNFKVAIMYDEDTDDPERATAVVISDLKYAYDRYIGPRSAVPNTSYLRYSGRPMIFIFPKGGPTDWNKVKAELNSWEDPPLLIYKDINARYADAFDGFYAWVNPGKKGWHSGGANWGEDYLENFYLRMKNDYPDKIAIGGAWPGFNDSRASWSRNRKMDARCGKTFEESLVLFRRYYPPERPLPFLMIDTWNDYEEGTAIEPGLANCDGKSPQTYGGQM